MISNAIEPNYAELINKKRETLVTDMKAYINEKLESVYLKLKASNDNVWIDEDRYNSISDSIGYVWDYMMSKMKNPLLESKLDSHKLASIAIMVILSCKPIVLAIDENTLVENEYANEILAIEVAMQIVLRFQINRFCKQFGHKDKLQVVAETIENMPEKYNFPGTINDIDSVEENIVRALRYFFSDGDRESFKASVWVFADLFFLLDTHSAEKVKARVAECLLELCKTDS